MKQLNTINPDISSHLNNSPLNLKKYPEDFGKKAELIIIEALKNNLPKIIEEVEMGTEYEDKIGKIDFWIKFRGIDEPIAIQFTFTHSAQKMTEKIKNLPQFAKKEQRNNSLIKWDKNAELILIACDKANIARAWKNFEEKSGREINIKPSDKIDSKIMIDILRQVLEKVNPAKKQIIINLLKDFEK